MFLTVVSQVFKSGEELFTDQVGSMGNVLKKFDYNGA